MTEETRKIVLEALASKFPEAEINVSEVVKSNLVTYNGLTIKEPGQNICPTINIDRYETESIEEIVEDILERYEEGMKEIPSLDLDIENMSKSTLLSSVKFRVLNKEKNVTLMETSPYREIENLILLPYIEGDGYSIRVTNSLLSHLETTKDEVFIAAEKNTIAVIKTMRETIMELISPDIMEIISPEPEEDTVPLSEQIMVVTNHEKKYGASAIFCNGLLQKIAEMMEGDLIILPSSIHEVLITRVDRMPLDFAKDMVCAVNREEVSESDFLADNVYLYKKDTDELSVS